MNKGDSGKHKTYSKLSVLIVGKSEPQPQAHIINYLDSASLVR